MTTDFICLLLLALWSIPLNHAPAIGRMTKAGTQWALGNRDSQPEGLPGWVGRADRAQRNHHDNLAMIAVVILVAQATGRADDSTATAALVILVARVAHGLFYIAGVGLLRSLSYVVALAAMLSIAWHCIAPLLG
jgi:uncharacterized MAPEG superfamily protein